MTVSYMHCNNHVFWHADLTRTYMPPKTIRAAARRYGVRNGLEEKEDEDLRDAPFTIDTPNYLTTSLPSLRASRSSSSLSPITQVQVLKFILFDAVLPSNLPLNSPTPTTGLRTYSDFLTPFEELLSSVILSRPIPHRLALSIIASLLNAPYSFRNAVTLKSAGPRRIRQALDSACTGYPGLEAEIDALFEALCNNDWHNDLTRLRAHARNPVSSQRDALRRSVAGLAPGGLDGFFGRVQWQWPEVFPFVDAATMEALETVGLPRRAEGLERMLEVRWLELEEGRHRSEGKGEEEKRRMTFVVCCERVRGVVREGRVREVLEAAQRVER